MTNNQTDKTAGSIVSLSKKGIEVACGDQTTILLQKLQPDGSKAMDVASLLNSRKEWFEKNPTLGASKSSPSSVKISS